MRLCVACRGVDSLETIHEGAIVQLLRDGFRELGEQQRELGRELGEQQRELGRELGVAIAGIVGPPSSATNKSDMSKVDFKKTTIKPKVDEYPIPAATEDVPEEVSTIEDLLRKARTTRKQGSEKGDREASIDNFFGTVAALYGISCLGDNTADNKLVLSDLYADTVTSGFCDLLVAPSESRRPLLGAIEIKPRGTSLSSGNCNQTMCYAEALRQRMPDDVPVLLSRMPVAVLSSLDTFIFYRSTGWYAYEQSRPTDDAHQVALYLHDLFETCRAAVAEIPADHRCRQGDVSPMGGGVEDSHGSGGAGGGGGGGGGEGGGDDRDAGNDAPGEGGILNETPIGDSVPLTATNLERHNRHLTHAAIRRLISF